MSLLPDLSSRRREREWMDAEDASPLELERSLQFIRRVNRLLGYTRATINELERFSTNWDRGRTIRILDVATGSADIPLAILAWADRRGFNVEIVGLDRHPATSRIAHLASGNDPRLSIVQGDAISLPFASHSFDYAMTTMFLHHLSDEQIVIALREMNRVASRGIVVSDLIRNRRAYLWITLFTLFSNPMVRHDARVSVAQAFTRAEIRTLVSLAGLNFVHWSKRFGHRFVLAGEK